MPASPNTDTMKPISAALTKHLKALPEAKLKLFYRRWLKWFQYDDDQKVEPKKFTVKWLVDRVITDSDPIAADGGLLDFMKKEKIAMPDTTTKTATTSKGISTKSQKSLEDYNSPGQKKLAKNKNQLKQVNAAIAKLKLQKGVQTYIKLAKMQLKLKSKLS